MKVKNPNHEYKTRDIGEAAALLCTSAQLSRLERDHHFFWFIFADKKHCSKLSHDYWFGELSVNAKSFHEALKTLKDRIFSA